tara:strand:+ start:822 stop:1472 length:651 start_codon:yes stop_codon:yes gene_type:complete
MENCDYLPEMIAAPEEETITMEVEDDDVLTDDDDDDGLPVVEQREKLLQEDIFQEVPKIAKISIARPSSPPTRKLSQVKLTAKGKPKRKPTQKQLDHLSTIRAKGQETRKKNAELRKKAALEGTEIPKSVRRKKELIETQKLIVTEKEKLSKQEIEEITFNAIAKHEELRKIRKEEKKKAQLEAQHTAHVQTTIRRAVGQPNPNDIWASALSGMFN